MSFQNKGFPNDLNSRYDAMNSERDTYAPKSQYMTTGLKLNPVGIPDYNDFTVINPALIEGVKEGIRTGQIKGNLPAINQPAFIKTDLPEFVINAPAKNKSKTIYYILSALILAVAIYFIYTYVKKNK